MIKNNSDNLRVIFITHYTELFGANKSFLSLMDGLLFIGNIELLVIVPADGPIVEELKKRSIPFRVVHFVNEIYFHNDKPALLKKIGYTARNWFAVIRNSRTLKQKNKRTVIHTISSANFLGAYFSFWLNVPHVWHIREFGLDDYDFRYNFGYKYFQFWQNKAAAVLTVSKAIYERRAKNSKAPVKTHVYNGVIFLKDLERREEAEKKITIRKENIVFGSIGLINSEKNQADALDAFIILYDKFKNTELIIAGSGNEEYVSMLEQKAKNNIAGNNIKFTGFINDTDAFYQSIDCLLMCSKNGALERVALEAMCRGIPVIGYDGGGTREIIVHGYDGLLYKKGPQELAEMMQLFFEDSELVKQMRINALKKVKENFTIEAYAGPVYSVYNVITGQINQ
jgi:glycosyltransferase involved in cell wall biosynthesis